MTESIYQRDDLALLKASGAEGSSTNGTGQLIGPTGLVEIVIHVTAKSGTSPTLDLAFEQCTTLGGSYAAVVKYPQITAVGVYRLFAKFTQAYVRYASTIGGSATPTFTYEVGVCKA